MEAGWKLTEKGRGQKLQFSLKLRIEDWYWVLMVSPWVTSHITEAAASRLVCAVSPDRTTPAHPDMYYISMMRPTRGRPGLTHTHTHTLVPVTSYGMFLSLSYHPTPRGTSEARDRKSSPASREGISWYGREVIRVHKNCPNNRTLLVRRSFFQAVV